MMIDNDGSLSLSLHCYPAYDLGCPVFKRTLLPTPQSVPAGLLLVQQCWALTSAISSPQTVRYSPSRTGLPSQKCPQGFNTIQNSKPTVCMDKVRPLLKYRACRKSDQVPLRPIDCGCSVLDVCSIKSGWCGCINCGWWKKAQYIKGSLTRKLINHQGFEHCSLESNLLPCEHQAHCCVMQAVCHQRRGGRFHWIGGGSEGKSTGNPWKPYVCWGQPWFHLDFRGKSTGNPIFMRENHGLSWFPLGFP